MRRILDLTWPLSRRNRILVARAPLERGRLGPMITHLDHLVLTVADISATVGFYCQLLGMREATFGDNRRAILFGNQKINLHERVHEFEPKAGHPTPGSADLCFISDTPLAMIVSQLTTHGVPIVEGPVIRTGAAGPLLSVYCRDPDGNLIEISNPIRNGDLP